MRSASGFVRPAARGTRRGSGARGASRSAGLFAGPFCPGRAATFAPLFAAFALGMAAHVFRDRLPLRPPRRLLLVPLPCFCPGRSPSPRSAMPASRLALSAPGRAARTDLLWALHLRLAGGADRRVSAPGIGPCRAGALTLAATLPFAVGELAPRRAPGACHRARGLSHGRAAPPPRTIFGVPVPIAIFFLAMMLPTAVSVNLGGLRLSAYRIVLIVMFLPMLVQLLSGRKGRMHVFDILVFAHCGWAMLALIKWGGLAQGIESGGIYVVEFAGAYLLAPALHPVLRGLRRRRARLCGLVVATLVFTVPEALTGVHILHDGISGALGGPMAPFIEPRMGLERTFGPFDHPILYGVFSASAFSLAYFVVAERRLMNPGEWRKVAGVGLATFMSASGGPYVVLMMQGFVAAWERVLGRVKGRWAALFTLFGLIYLAIDLFSTGRPSTSSSTISPSRQSAYNRILIFEYGTAEVARHPVFGIGLGDWERPSWMSDSMDNFWLVVAVRYGIPGLPLLLACSWAWSGRWGSAGSAARVAPCPACLGLHAVRHHRRGGDGSPVERALRAVPVSHRVRGLAPRRAAGPGPRRAEARTVRPRPAPARLF
jgi:hypothetical protein